MAFTPGNLQLHPVAPGDNTYIYDAGSDTMKTVITANYFLDSSANSVNLQAEDLVWCQCGDGNMWLRVSAATSTSVTTQWAGGDQPINTAATGTEAALSGALVVGFMEVGTSISTASRYVLPTPYPGAPFTVRKVDSGTQSFEFDAGGSGATGVTYDAVGNRRILLRQEMEGFHVRGSSTTRWRLYEVQVTSTGKDGSYAGEGASNWIGATA